MMRRVRPWGLALAGSLLLHAALFGGLQWEWPQWTPVETPPIEVRLVTPPQPAPVPLPPVVPPASPVQPALPAPRPVAPEPAAEPIAEHPVAPDSEISVPVPAVAVGPAEGVLSAPLTEAPAEPALPPLNPLPPRLDLRYELGYGIASGEQTLVWINEGERYTVTSVAAATGLTGIFYRGRFVQTSRGRVTPQGLQPEEFWDQRGDKHSRARFDPDRGQLTLTPAKGGPRHFSYQGEVQDALSLFFQFALTAPPSGNSLAYQVFNGKKLRNYRYEVRGEGVLETRLGTLRTLHLARAADGDGRFEIWLAIDRHYLPVRVLRSDETGSEMSLNILSITP